MDMQFGWAYLLSWLVLVMYQYSVPITPFQCASIVVSHDMRSHAFHIAALVHTQRILMAIFD